LHISEKKAVDSFVIAAEADSPTVIRTLDKSKFISCGIDRFRFYGTVFKTLKLYQYANTPR
jgi:hypothetical protein